MFKQTTMVYISLYLRLKQKMKGSYHKKLSGAQGRKRKKEQDEEAKKSSKVMAVFLQKGKDPGSSKSVEDNNSPSTITPIIDTLHFQEERTSSESSDGSEGGQRDCGEREHVEKPETNQQKSSVPSQVDVPSGVTHQDELGVTIKKTVPEVIEHQDIGYLKFDISRKVTISDALRTEI